MEYTVEKFIGIKSLTGALGAFGKTGAKTGAKGADEIAEGGANALKNVGTLGTKKTRTFANAADEATGVGAKVGDDVVDGAGTAAKVVDGAGTAAKVGDDVVDGAGTGLKNADEMADKLTDAAKTNQKLSSKIGKVLKNNPGKTLAAALIIAAGAAGLAFATEGFNKSNNQPLTIINSYATTGGDEGDVTIEYTADSGVTVVDGDSVIVNPPNDQENLSSSGQVSNYFIPATIYGQTIQVKTIISSSSIVINYPGLVGYAKKGVLTLQTTMENRLLDQAEKGVAAAQELTGTALGTVLGPFKKILGPYLIYAQGCCCCICCLILISIIYKVSKMAK